MDLDRRQQLILRTAFRYEISFYISLIVIIFILFTAIMLINYYYNNNDISVVNIIIIYICVVLLATVIVWYKSYFRYRGIHASLTWHRRISVNDVENVLQNKFIKANDNEIEDNSEFCFCMEEKEDEIVELLCKHKFHISCISNWLVQNNSCPNCRKENIIVRDDFRN